MRALDGQQADIGGPGEGECLGQLTQTRLHRCDPRRCEFSRQCLENLFRPPGLKEKSHLPQVLVAEPPAKLPGQIQRKPFNQLFAITGTPLALLLGLHDAPPDFPVAGGHQRIDVAGRRQPGRVQQLDNTVAHSRVARNGSNGFAFVWDSWCFHGEPLFCTIEDANLSYRGAPKITSARVPIQWHRQYQARITRPRQPSTAQSPPATLAPHHPPRSRRGCPGLRAGWSRPGRPAGRRHGVVAAGWRSG